MGLEGMDRGIERRENPEARMSRQQEGGSAEEFNATVDRIKEETAQMMLNNTPGFAEILRENGYPEDEEMCDKLGEKFGLGAHMVAKMSRILKGEK